MERRSKFKTYNKVFNCNFDEIFVECKEAAEDSSETLPTSLISAVHMFNATKL
ncbi:hypothetical protein J1N35_026691 [Gossypium stocksii]|uniref:Uncharacterized protein n=1 Tax=Gossypium stocksii TaxID=47602 RepID=A0A9D3VA60_9ROSI|nr:hypothetical protein J1N35_026691 [Gossypium stocksii]